MRPFKGLILIVLLLTAFAAPAAAKEPAVKVIPVPGMAFGSVLSPDGRLLAMFENGQIQDGVVDPLLLPLRLLDLESGDMRLLSGHTDYATDGVFSPDGSTFASYHGNGFIYLWDVASGAMIKTIPAIPGGAGLAYHPDGAHLVGLVGNSLMVQVAVWDTTTGAITALLMPRPTTFQEILDRSGIPDTGLEHALSPDGAQVAVATMYSRVQLWDLATGEYRMLVESEDEQPRLNIRALAYTPDGSRLVYQHWDEKKLYIVDLATVSEVAAIDNVQDALFAISPDGVQIAWVNGKENTLNVASLDQPGTPTTISLPVSEDYTTRAQPRLSSLTFTPDGQQIVFSGFISSDKLKNAVYVISLAQ
jgi:WD40 repeat protein